MEENKKQLLELAGIALFVALFLFLNLAQPWSYSLAHKFPSFYNANDNFLNGYIEPQHIKETGNYLYEPEYTVGGHSNIVGFFPPIFYHLSALLSIISGLETYDTSYILAVFFSITTALVMYFIIRQYSPELAALSLPFMLGIFNIDFEIARIFGLWMYVTGTLFFVSVVWTISRIQKRASFIFLAIFLSGAMLGHPPEAIFSVGFIAAWFFTSYLKERKIEKGALKNLAFGGILALAISAYYVIVFKYTLMASEVNHYRLFSVMTAPDFAPSLGVTLWDFGTILPILVVGLLISAKRLAFRKTEEIPFTAIVAGLFALFAGYSNYLGAGIRAWQTRTSWPITLAIFSGIALYYAILRIRKNWGVLHFSAISIALLLVFATLHAGQLKGGGIADEETWNALMWIKNSTPENSKVYYYYMPLATQQFSLWSAERTPYIIDTTNYIAAAQSGIVKDEYKAYLFAANGVNTDFAYRTSLTEYQYLADNASIMNSFANRSSADADYHVLQIGGASNNPAVSQYNSAIRNKLLKSEKNITEVFNNGVVSILKQQVH